MEKAEIQKIGVIGKTIRKFSNMFLSSVIEERTYKIIISALTEEIKKIIEKKV